jgi:Ca-activated chloride channel family protein
VSDKKILLASQRRATIMPRPVVARLPSPLRASALWTAGLLSLFAVAGFAWITLKGWQVQLKHPWALLALPIALLLWGATRWLYRGVHADPGRAAPRLKVSQGRVMASMPRTVGTRFVNLPPALRACAIALLAVAMTRPQRVDAPDELELSGIDIVISLDLSGSMRAADLQPTRLEAAKEVISEFIRRRRSDRIGLVVFGRSAYTVVPPTLDYTVLSQMVESLSLELIDGSGTAIGDGLGTALNRLRRSDARSKVVVLLTDGANNAGHVDPREAAQLASALHCKVYTVLMGTSEEAPVQQGVDLAGNPVYARARFAIDPQLLQDIATTTHGEFFRAADKNALARSFHSILDRLERSRIADAGVRYGELFPAPALAALLLLALEAVLSATRLRRFP